MKRARYNQETRDFIEGVFKTNDYTVDQKIHYLETRERQKYNYYCDCSYMWSNEDNIRYQSEWNEIIDMLNELKGAIQ